MCVCVCARGRVCVCIYRRFIYALGYADIAYDIKKKLRGVHSLVFFCMCSGRITQDSVVLVRNAAI